MSQKSTLYSTMGVIKAWP